MALGWHQWPRRVGPNVRNADLGANMRSRAGTNGDRAEIEPGGNEDNPYKIAAAADEATNGSSSRVALARVRQAQSKLVRRQ
jgi:hypothetical protein